MLSSYIAVKAMKAITGDERLNDFFQTFMS